MFAEEIKKSLAGILPEAEISLEHPAGLAHGDYSTNVALVLAKKEGKNPKEAAEELVQKWQKVGLPDFVNKVEVAGPGFINIWLKICALSTSASLVLKEGNKHGFSRLLAGKKILLEHTSPNPQTTIMLGHLRNNFLGMSLAKILEFLGAKVTLDDIVNDRGVHLCRSMWGYLAFCQKQGGLSKKELLDFRSVDEEKIKKISEKVNWQRLLADWLKNPAEWWTPEELGLKSDHANLIWYVSGSSAYKVLPAVQKQVEEILQAWEKENFGVRQLWRQVLSWSETGYAETYRRIGSHHDWVWHESDHWQKGKEIVEEGLKKGVFRKSQGAIVTDLERYGLPDTVVVKTDGTTLYITQDLALTKLKKEKFPSGLYIWDIGQEQTLYFKQLFAVIDQLGIMGKDKLFHLAYALINFKGGGKMATRSGSVVMADEILDELHKKALAIIKTTNWQLRDQLSAGELDEVAEKVALAAVKYSLLKYGRETTMFFDPEESLALQGNSGPYLQYTYARTQSVLRKSEIRSGGCRTKFEKNLKFKIQNFSNEEQVILRTFYKFPDIIVEAAKTYSPNLICNFLFDLSQKFNLFYDKERILGSENESFRLLLTAAVGQILKNGLQLLGIEALERM